MLRPNDTFHFTHHPLIPSWLVTMSSTFSGFVCINPHCGSRRHSFANERAYTMHIERSLPCFQFLRQHEASMNTARQHTGIKRTADEVDSTIKVTSKTKATRLQCEHVNDAPPLPVDNHYLSCPIASWIDVNNENETWDDESIDPNFDKAFDASGGAAAGSGSNSILPNTVALLSASQDCTATPFMYTTDQKWTMALLKVLDDLNAPDYAFGAVLEWARSANASGYSFYPTGGLSRSRNLEVMFKSVHNAHRMLPSVRAVEVPHGPPIDVITYDFASQLLSLLQNPTLMTANNVLIDLMNPLHPYTSPDGRLGEAISGTVYRDAYLRLITNPQRQLFVPIIQWIDRTSVTGNDRFSLKPYMFTPAIFKEPFRRTIQAWGYHGFLPKPKTSSAQNQVKRPGDNIRNYHAQLNAVLQSFSNAGPRLCNVTLPIGPSGFMCVDIVTCILFVIQDMQEGDTLCGRFGPHTPQIQRHCRACDVSYADLDNPVRSCTFVKAADMAAIAHSRDDELRTQWSQHHVNNVFDHVPMADPVRGIFGATPVETLHAYRKGLIEMVTYLVLENVPASKKAALDALAIRFHTTHRQTCRKDYPSTDYSTGITNKTKLSASERVGLVFLFVILAQYDEGWDIMYTALRQRSAASLTEVLNVFEALLCFDAWLNQSTYWKMSDHAASKIAVSKSIRLLLEMCQKHIPLVHKKHWKLPGKTWKFPKFHELLHLVEDMERFGASNNYCAQRPESLLIPVAKEPG